MFAMGTAEPVSLVWKLIVGGLLCFIWIGAIYKFVDFWRHRRNVAYLIKPKDWLDWGIVASLFICQALITWLGLK